MHGRRPTRGTGSSRSSAASWARAGGATHGCVIGAAARSFAFASRVPPSLVDFLLQLTRPNPVHALVSLIPQFLTLDKRAALPVLGQVDTLVVGAEDDQTIEPRHSEAIADAVPNARLAMLPNAGHMVPLEHPTVLGELLQGLITRATTR